MLPSEVKNKILKEIKKYTVLEKNIFLLSFSEGSAGFKKKCNVRIFVL